MGKKIFYVDDENDIAALIQSDVIPIVQNDIAAEIHNMLAKEYQEQVYSYPVSYLYNRRNSLTNPENMKDTVSTKGNTVILEVRHEAKPNTPLLEGYSLDENANLADWIEDGDIYNIFDPAKDYVWTHPRKVFKATQDKLDASDQFIDIIVSKLQAQGYDITK